MKWFIVGSFLLLVTLAAAKSPDKHKSVKKASSAKPTKHPKSILDEFSGLTADDTKFLKELDKQFKIHGEKIKIKVEKENTTAASTGKNSKRTIDGSLGYGYHAPRRPQGFHFSRPRFEVYPYSQNDIPPSHHQQQWAASHGYSSAPQHYHQHQQSVPQSQLHTSVSIEQSHGFEITPDEYNGYAVGGALGHQQQQYYNYPQQHQQLGGQDQVPVIVLRIPGPTKYAAHLQALLQRYLEIRAEQYITELQQQEQQHYQQQQQQQQQEIQHESVGHVEQQQYVSSEKPYAAPGYLPKVTQAAVQNYVTQVPDHSVSPGHGYSTPEPILSAVSEGAVVDTARAVYESHQIVHQQAIALEHGNQEHISHQVSYAPQEQSPSPPTHHEESIQQDYQSYTQQYSYDTAPQHPDDQHHQQEQQPPQYVYEEAQIPISENYPSNRHTQVIFSNPHHSTVDTQQESFQLPIHVQAQSPHQLYHSPAPQYQYTNGYTQDDEHSADYQQISITPKSHGPYNYHAHPTENPRNSKRNANHQYSSKISARLRKTSTSTSSSSTHPSSPSTMMMKAMKPMKRMRMQVKEEE